jgi:hypothetical protein
MAQGDQDDFGETAQARTAGRDVLGKLDDHLPEIRVPYEIRQLVERTAREDGLDVTTWLRELVYARVVGPDHLASLYRERAERVLGNVGQLPRPGEIVTTPARRS